jgi:hypothetical protein
MAVTVASACGLPRKGSRNGGRESWHGTAATATARTYACRVGWLPMAGRRAPPPAAGVGPPASHSPCRARALRPGACWLRTPRVLKIKIKQNMRDRSRPRLRHPVIGSRNATGWAIFEWSVQARYSFADLPSLDLERPAAVASSCAPENISGRRQRVRRREKRLCLRARARWQITDVGVKLYSFTAAIKLLTYCRFTACCLVPRH